jgi:hypothetical protein
MIPRWLTIPDAARELGISKSTLRSWCNEKPPRIEHKREGTRGRGGKGTILIERAVIDAHNNRRRLVAAADDAKPFTVQHRKSRFFSPHLEPEKYGLA